jgi:hypothetical protein
METKQNSEPPDLALDLDAPVPFAPVDIDEPIAYRLTAVADDGLGFARGCLSVVTFWIVLTALAALVLFGRPLLGAIWRAIA